MGHFRAVLGIAAAVAWFPLGAQQPALDPAVPPAVVQTVPTPDDRVTIPIHIGGRGPWNFVIDTGAQRTVISRDLAQRLALTPATPVTVISMTGRTETPTVAIPRLGFGETVVHDIEAPVLEGEHLGAAGLLGLDGLHAKRLTLNFRTGRMQISESRRADRDPDAIIVEAQRRRGQLILLDSQVNRMKVNIILDTGTTISVGNSALMNRLIRRKRAPILQGTRFISVTGEEMTGQLGQIGEVRMGGVTLRNIPVLFADAAPFRELGLQDKPALLLGIQALKAFDRVAIDFGRGKVDFLLPDAGSLDPGRLANLLRARG